MEKAWFETVSSSYIKFHWGFASTVLLLCIDVLSVGWWEDDRIAEAEKTRNISISHNNSRWREGGAGKTSKCVGTMENQKALEKRRRKGKRVEKLHTNPKPPQEQDTDSGQALAPGTGGPV